MPLRWAKLSPLLRHPVQRGLAETSSLPADFSWRVLEHLCGSSLGDTPASRTSTPARSRMPCLAVEIIRANSRPAMGDEAAPTGPSIDEVMRRNDEYVAEARKKVLDPAAEAAALRDMFEGACVSLSCAPPHAPG